jgi:hypothetical protein
MMERFERQLENVDEGRRAAILTLVRTAAFAVPVLTSFAIDGRLTVAYAQTSPNGTG